MSQDVTGHIVQTERGADLLLARSLALPLAEAWAYFSEPALTDEWFGAWEGDARTGGGVHIRLRYETNHPVVRAKILACEAPHRLEVQTDDEYGSWHVEVRLDEDGDDDTLVNLVHHLDAHSDVAQYGPGWEFYLDVLIAATEGTERPEFDEYFRALGEEYATLGGND